MNKDISELGMMAIQDCREEVSNRRGSGHTIPAIVEMELPFMGLSFLAALEKKNTAEIVISFQRIDRVYFQLFGRSI